MARKFKVGDKVKFVKKFGHIGEPCKLGFKGKIINIFSERKHNSYAYDVRSFNNKIAHCFNAQELEILN